MAAPQARKAIKPTREEPCSPLCQSSPPQNAPHSWTANASATSLSVGVVTHLMASHKLPNPLLDAQPDEVKPMIKLTVNRTESRAL